GEGDQGRTCHGCRSIYAYDRGDGSRAASVPAGSFNDAMGDYDIGPQPARHQPARHKCSLEPIANDERAMKGMAAVAASVEEASARTAPPGLLPETRSRRPTEPRGATLPLPADLEPSIYRFIIRHSWRPQLALLIFTLASFPFLYASLNLPKTIINHAIAEAAKFPQTILGFQFERVSYLMVLCFAFLAVVLINGGFKYCINTFKGQLGERMLRRFRYQLYLRLLRFPLTYFQTRSSAQIIP